MSDYDYDYSDNRQDELVALLNEVLARLVRIEDRLSPPHTEIENPDASEIPSDYADSAE